MEEQKSRSWPILLLVFIVIISVGAAFYFYPRENKILSDTAGVELSLFATTTNSESSSMSTSTENITVLLNTNQGPITIELFADQAPKTVKNFTDLAKAGFYDNILFHRVIKGFMVQSGDPLTKSEPKNWGIHGTGGPGYKFEDEQNDLKLERGVIAMANSGPNTNGSQFFIMTAKEPMQLQGYYTAFGRVISGMETVDKIEATPVNERDHPLSDMVITSIEIK